MGIKLMVAIAMVAMMAAPAFASVQNVKVSGSLKTTSVIRSNFSTANNNDKQNDILGQTGLTVAADLTDNVSTNISLTNERLWGTTTASNNNAGVNIDNAYVTMKELLYSPLTVTVGRQSLAYGNQLIIGDGDAWTNVGAIGDLTGGVNFDAIKAVLNYDPLTVDLFAARVSNGTIAGMGVDATHDDANLFGVNANYKMGDKMSTVVEGYVFAKVDNTGATMPNPAGDITDKTSTIYTPGLRVSTNPIEGLNVQLEGAYQLGQYEGQGMQSFSGAYALQGLVNYALPVMKDMKPVLGAGYTYLSGNKSYDGPNGTKRGWDNTYEGQNGGRIFDNLLSSTNQQVANLSLEVAPIKDVTTKLSMYNVWRAEKAGYVAGTTSSSKYLGTEGDLDVTYAYTEDVKFGVSAGYFMTGKNYITPNNKNAAQLLTSVAVLF